MVMPGGGGGIGGTLLLFIRQAGIKSLEILMNVATCRFLLLATVNVSDSGVLDFLHVQLVAQLLAIAAQLKLDITLSQDLDLVRRLPLLARVFWPLPGRRSPPGPRQVKRAGRSQGRD